MHGVLTVETHQPLNYCNYAACLFDFDGVIIEGHPDSAFFGHVATELASRRVSAEEMPVFKQNAYSRRFGDVPLVAGVLDSLAVARRSFSEAGPGDVEHAPGFRVGWR